MAPEEEIVGNEIVILAGAHQRRRPCPEGEPGGIQDREVVSFTGRVLTLRWVDPEVQGRYGTMVYVRCAPEGQKRKPVRAKPKPAAKPKPKT